MKTSLLLASGLFLCVAGYSQNLGIGTTNPLFKLDVRNGSINTDSVYRIGTITILSVTGIANTFVGKNVGANSTGGNNSGNGYQALFANTAGTNNTAHGFQTLYANTTGYSNTATGAYTMTNNTTGSNNSAHGLNALRGNTDGVQNTANGYNALQSNQTGDNNTASGFNALYFNTTGNNNTAIGYYANVSSGALTNATAIGAQAIVNASNKIRLGSSTVTAIEGPVAYTFPSDGRFKTNVTETVIGLDFIMKLRPVVYNFQAKKMDEFLSGLTSDDARFANLNYAEGERIRQSGFIAQDVEKAAREAGYDFNGVVAPKNEKETYSLAYSQFVVPLVKAVQEQQAVIEQQNKKIEMLMKEIDLIKEKL